MDRQVWAVRKVRWHVDPDAWFSDAGFREQAFTPVADSLASVGVHRLVGPSVPFQPGVRLFEFTRAE
jgi:hypothetical protein